MMGSMIERVAKALAKESGRADPSAWPQYSDAAKAVIRAMREPDASMLRRVTMSGSDLNNHNAGTLWVSFIDAALAEDEITR